MCSGSPTTTPPRAGTRPSTPPRATGSGWSAASRWYVFAGYGVHLLAYLPDHDLPSAGPQYAACPRRPQLPAARDAGATAGPRHRHRRPRRTSRGRRGRGDGRAASRTPSSTSASSGIATKAWLATWGREDRPMPLRRRPRGRDRHGLDAGEGVVARARGPRRPARSMRLSIAERRDMQAVRPGRPRFPFELPAALHAVARDLRLVVTGSERLPRPGRSRPRPRCRLQRRPTRPALDLI